MLDAFLEREASGCAFSTLLHGSSQRRLLLAGERLQKG